MVREILDKTPTKETATKNLYFEPLDISPLPVEYNNRPHSVETKGIQGFTGISGYVERHQEEEGVTEMYFPLCGSVFVTSGDKFFKMQGVLDPSVLSECKMKVDFNQTSQFLHVWFGDYPKSGLIISPVIIPPGTEHATSWYRTIHGPIEPRFLVMKLRPINH